MKKFYFILGFVGIVVVGFTFIAHATTVFNSNQLGTNPTNGYYLQTNGTTSTWSPVSGGSGSSTLLYPGTGIGIAASGTNGYVVSVSSTQLNNRLSQKLTLVFTGDSLTAGHGLSNSADNNAACRTSIASSSCLDWPNQMETMSSFNGRVATSVNVAISGVGIGYLLANYTSTTHPYAPSVTGNPAILFVWIGANDFASIASSTMEASDSAYFAEAEADGFTLAVGTIQPRGDTVSTAGEQRRKQVNQWLVSQTGIQFQYLLNYAQLFQNPYDQTYFQSDHIHQNAEGFYLIAKYVTSVMWGDGSTGLLDSTYESVDQNGNMSLDANSLSLSTAGGNTACGFLALQFLTTGAENTACGQASQNENTSGTFNTSVGYGSFQNEVAGNQNVVIGGNAMNGAANASTSDNVCVGYRCEFVVTNAFANTISGWEGGQNITTGGNNEGYGASTLLNLTTGTDTVSFGELAGSNLTTGANNIVLGNYISLASTTSNSIDIDNLIFATGTTPFTTATTTISAGNVGIGTANPTAKLTVNGNVNFDGGGITSDGSGNLSVLGSGGLTVQQSITQNGNNNNNFAGEIFSSANTALVTNGAIVVNEGPLVLNYVASSSCLATDANDYVTSTPCGGGTSYTSIVQNSSTGQLAINAPNATSSQTNFGGNRYYEYDDYLNAVTNATWSTSTVPTTLVISTTTGLAPQGLVLIMNKEIASYTNVVSAGTSSTITLTGQNLWSSAPANGNTGQTVVAIADLEAPTATSSFQYMTDCTTAVVTGCQTGFRSVPTAGSVATFGASVTFTGGAITQSGGANTFASTTINGQATTTYLAVGSSTVLNGFVQFTGSSTIITPSIGGAIVSGGCDSATSSIDISIPSSTTGFPTTPQNDPGTTLGGTWAYSFIQSPGVLLTRVCSNVSVTPNSTPYVVKIIR